MGGTQVQNPAAHTVGNISNLNLEKEIKEINVKTPREVILDIRKQYFTKALTELEREKEINEDLEYIKLNLGRDKNDAEEMKIAITNEKSTNDTEIVECMRITNVSKHKKVRIYYYHTLVDPDGYPIKGLDEHRSFVLAGERASGSSSAVKGKKKGRGNKGGKKFLTKPPPVASKVFGNEGIPKIAAHLNPLKNYLFSGSLPAVTYASSTTLNQVTTYSWTIGSLDGISSYTSLFDEYCVRRIEVWFMPGNTEQTSSGQFPSQLYTAYDVDGASITTLSDLRQYDTLVETPCTMGQYVSFTPSVAIATYGGAFTKYSFEMNQWLDVANTDIQLYGLASALDLSTQASQFQFAIDVRLWIEFRGVR